MNGILPGPLWLAIASSVNRTPTENRTLTYPSENATVTGVMTKNQEHLTNRERSGLADGAGEPHPQKLERKRQGG